MELKLLVLDQKIMNTKKPKLLIVGAFSLNNTNVFGGILTTCKILLQSSFSENFKLVLIDSTQITNPPPSFPIRLLLAAGRLFKFIVSFYSSCPDAVILFTSSVGSSILEKGLMAWISRTKSLPVFLFPRGAGLIDTVNNSQLQRIWIETCMRGATHILCQGETWQRFATTTLNYPISHAPIIKNWSATTTLLEIGNCRRFVDYLIIPTVLFLGWLEREKGIFELLEACRELFYKGCKFKLIIAGRGHAEFMSKSFVDSNNLQGDVEFVGWVQGVQKEALLKTADILVLPSWAEGFPNAIIEAMATKVAVIVSSVGNIPDIITDRQEAILIPPKNTRALQSAIGELLKDTSLRREIAERGYVFARENFSVEIGITKLTSVIKEAICENITNSKVV